MFKKELYNLVKGTKEEVHLAFNKLTEAQKKEVIEIFGIDSSKNIYSGNKRAIGYIQKIIDKNYKRNILEIFPDKSKKEIKDAFDLLKEKDKSCISKYYIWDNSRVRIDEVSLEDRNNLDKAVRKLKYKINTKDNVKNIVYKPIYESLNVDKERLNLILSLLSEEDKNLLYKKFGKSLNDNSFKPDLTLEENKYIGTIIFVRIKRIIYKLDNGYSIYGFYDLFSNVPKDVLMKRFNKLSDNQKNEMYILFNKDLSKKLLLSEKEINIIFSGYRKNILKILMGKEIKVHREFTSFFDLFIDLKREDESIEEFENRVLSVLPKIKEEYLHLVFKKYGSDLRNTKNNGNFTKEESNLIFKNVYYKVRYYLKERETKVKLGKTIMERLENHGTHKEILIALCELEDKEMDLLRKYYGFTLGERPLTAKISEEDETKIKYILDKVGRIIIKNKSRETGLTSLKLIHIRSIMFTPTFKELSKIYDGKILHAYLIKLKYPELSNEVIYSITSVNLEKVKEYISNIKESIKDESFLLSRKCN